MRGGTGDQGISSSSLAPFVIFQIFYVREGHIPHQMIHIKLVVLQNLS